MVVYGQVLVASTVKFGQDWSFGHVKFVMFGGRVVEAEVVAV